MSTDFVIKIPNQFLRELNEEELYFYFFLRVHESKHFRNRVITNIQLLEEQIQFLASK